MEDNLKHKTAKGLLWGGLSNGLVQVLGALFGIVLLRLLSPADYGKIAVLLIFSSVASNIQESGFIAALCNRKEPTHEEYNAVFWFNCIVSVMLYALLWMAAPLIADFYHEPVLTPLARYLFLGFLLSGFGTVQRAYIFGHMMVKQYSISGVIALVVSNSIAVVMASMGFAFWGLATQSVAYVLVVMLLNWYVSPWRPTMPGKSIVETLRPAFVMFGFSSKLLVTNLFNQLNSHVFSILLGRYYTTSTVGLYSNARKWDDMAVNTVNGMMTGVSQPVLARVMGDDGRYHNVFRKMLRFVSFVSFPCMFGLALIAREFILITVGEQWVESAALLSMLCVHGAFFPISILYSNMAISRGRSDINMLCTISLCIVIWVGLIAVHEYGIYAMVTFFITVNVAWLLVWQWFARRLFRLSYVDALKDVVPFLMLAGMVMVTTWYVTSMIDNIYLSLLVKIVLAVILYCGLTYLSGARIMRETIDYLIYKKLK